MTTSAQFPTSPGNPLTGTAQVVTTNYQVVATDAGTWIVVNAAGAVTVTLPATAPNAQFTVGVISIGAGTTTIARNGNNINGVAANISLVQNNGVVFATDGTNWFVGIPTAAAAVTSVAGRTGAVVLAESDITSLVADLALKAPLNSPALTGTPTAPTGATGDSSTLIATDQFVSTAIANAIAGVDPAVAVQAATAAILPNSPTYDNGVGGVGAFITTATTNTPLVVDGYTPVLNDRILVKNESLGGGLGAGKNGVYFVSQVSGISAAWILMRALDYNQPSDINNTGAIPVINGTVNTTSQWVLSSKITAVDGTQALTYTQFTVNPASIAADTGVLTKTVGYTVLSTDNGKWIVVNDASSATILLPAAAPTAPWFVGIINIGAGLVTISPNGLNLNGAASSTTLKTGQGTRVVTDAANYFCALQVLSQRTTTSKTTGSLTAGQVETGTVTLAKTILVVAVSFSVNARVELYSTSAAATADVARPITTPVTVGTQNEIIMDVNLNAATGLSWIMSPAAWGSDGKGSPDGNLAYNITNQTSGTTTVTVTWTYIALE